MFITEEKYKNYSKLLIIAIFVFLALAVIAYLNLYASSIQPNRTFVVSGEGKMSGVPDIVQLSFGVLTEGGKNIASLTKENNDKIDIILASLKQNNIQEKDIVTELYNITPRYQYFACNAPLVGSAPCPPPEIVGYSVNQNISVKIRDIKKSGDIISAVVSQGANTVSGLSFTIDDPSTVQNQAREKAIANAKKNADLLAQLGGFKAGKIVSMQEGISSFRPVSVSDKIGLGGGGAAIEPGSLEISATITIVYEIL